MADRPRPSVSASGIDPGLTPYVELARTDLAARLSIPATTIAVVTAAVVTWPDTSMGCPRPGMSYAQVTTDGSFIKLKVGDRVYGYHSGGNTKPFLCQG